jgi:RHS repeat-associated protein
LVSFEYLWFNGEPLAQIETATGAIHWYFNDHLATPILSTNSSGVVDWRVEREPYGSIFATRAGAERHQPLSLPGQEYDPNQPERAYNIFRWYRAGWGRYTQADPIGVRGGTNLYRYAKANPLSYIDPTGLQCSEKCPDCPGGIWLTAGIDVGFTVKIGFAGFGAGVGYFAAQCLSSPKRCHFATLCSRLFGAGASASGTVAIGAQVNAKCAKDLEGIQWGVEGELGKGGGGSVSGDVSPSGSWGAKVGGGAAVGGSAVFQLCEVKTLSCN